MASFFDGIFFHCVSHIHIFLAHFSFVASLISIFSLSFIDDDAELCSRACFRTLVMLRSIIKPESTFRGGFPERILKKSLTKKHGKIIWAIPNKCLKKSILTFTVLSADIVSNFCKRSINFDKIVRENHQWGMFFIHESKSVMVFDLGSNNGTRGPESDLFSTPNTKIV